MANSPIDTGAFTFFLNLKSLGIYGYQITGVAGFDVANFVVKQNDGRFGRDIFFGNETEDLAFYKNGKGELMTTEQVTTPDGNISKSLDNGFAWILETWLRFGYEGEIEFVLKKDGITFTVGVFDMPNCDTDGDTYFKCTIIQNTKIADYKRQLSSTIDLFSTKNFRNKSITPAPTLKFLRRSVPVTNQSQWNKSNNITFFVELVKRVYVNFTRTIIIQDIKNTLDGQCDVVQDLTTGGIWRQYTFAQFPSGTYTDTTDGVVLKLIKAKKQLVNTTVNVRLKATVTAPLLSTGETTTFFYFVMVADEGEFNTNFDANKYRVIASVVLNDTTPVHIDINETVTIPDKVPMDKVLYGAWTGSNLENITVSSVTDALVTITSSEVSLDTVISGVRIIDVKKQCSKFINDLPIDAEIFDVGGEHYNNVCYNRALLSLETSNSLDLINDTTPAGYLGQVVHNTNNTITGVLPLGLYFWNGTNWISLNSTIEEVFLSDDSTPSGTTEGQLIYNTNDNISIPKGLCYWNGTVWVSLEYTSPFITTTKDCFENAMTVETCSDYEIQEEKIFFGKYEDFYINYEVGAFLINATKDYKRPFNERFKLNNFKLGYDTFETNRLSLNTANDIHTVAEWFTPNFHVENKYERNSKYIRSGYSAQAMDDLQTTKPATADDNDDKVFIERIIELPEGTQGIISAKLKLSVDGTKVSVLNRDSTGDANDVVISWGRYGFPPLGGIIHITSGQNIGSYSIGSLSSNLLVLLAIGFTPDFTGDAFITITWTYTGILWQTKHNQGFNLVAGLENPTQCPNLDYSLGNDLYNYRQFLASVCLFSKADSKIKNLAFKNNPALRTQKLNTDPIIIEKGSINVSDLPIPILGSRISEIEVYASFGEMVALLTAMKTNRGYIRCYDLEGRVILGYPLELDYTWKTGALTLKLEEKYEPYTIVLTFANGVLTVNDAVYNLNGTVNWWKITGEYFQTFDANEKAISSVRHFSKVSLNGTIYSTVQELSEALNNL